MGYEYQEFPKTLYRVENGFAVGHTFARAEDVEPGWVSIEEVGAPIEPPPPPPVAKPEIKADDGANPVERLLKMQESLKLVEDDLAAEKTKTEAGAKRIVELETFAAAIAEGEDIPDDARELARGLLGAPAKSKPKARAAKA